ncbi:MAG: ferredoxin [candidate division Zixibacteria bacterium SM23_73]|nr:MAG: ferredoxin [candidate division Zixibacteria bacterium SM23_73]
MKSQKTSAIVDEEECTGCALCSEVCPTGAISVTRIAQIDSSKCIACLACVNQCPQGAIAVKYPNR